MISRPLAITFAGFALLGAAVLGAFVYDRMHPTLVATRAAPPIAAAQPTLAPAVPDATVPAVRPDVSLPDPEGKSHSLREWDGQTLLVNFWATWCAPCRREMPLLNRIKQEYAGKGVEIVGIAVDVVADVKSYLAKSPVGYPVLVGEQEGIDAARDFGVTEPVFPFTVFLDSKGRVLLIHVGELHEPMARAILAVALDPKTVTLGPDEARAAVKAAVAALPPEPATPAR